MQSEPYNSGSLPRHATYGNNRGLTQAYQIRNIAAEQALALKSEPAASLKDKQMLARALKDLARVWVDASERIRIIRGRPLPGSFKPKAPVKKRKAYWPSDKPLFTDDPTNDSPPEPQGTGS